MPQYNFHLRSYGYDNVYVSGLLDEYDQILLGNRRKYSSLYFSFANNVNELMALTVFRYAIERYLKWTPVQAYNMLTFDVVNQMHLAPLLTQIHSFPAELNKRKDCWYIVHRLYPHIIPLNKRALITSLMSRVIDGRAKFPDDYFFSEDGEFRACVCLQHILGRVLIFKDIESMYAFFSNTQAANKSLQQYNLLNAYKMFFDTPLEFLHMALPEHQKNEFYYEYYSFKKKFDSIK